MFLKIIFKRCKSIHSADFIGMARHCFYVLCWCLYGYAWAWLRSKSVHSPADTQTVLADVIDVAGQGCECGLICVCVSADVSDSTIYSTSDSNRSYTVSGGRTSFPHCMFDWEVLTTEICLDMAYKVWIHTCIHDTSHVSLEHLILIGQIFLYNSHWFVVAPTDFLQNASFMSHHTTLFFLTE